jgi:hypothetical protein
MVFLSETKLQSSDLRQRTNSFGPHLSNHFVVDCNISHCNRGGGLAMLWTSDVNLNIIGYNENMIDCFVDCGNTNNSWRATGIYGYPKHHQKTMTCELISNLNHSNNFES